MGRGRVGTISRVINEVFTLEVGKCFEEGDPACKCVGTGKVAVLLGHHCQCGPH